MADRLKVSSQAKKKARQGLEFNKGKPKSKQAGLTKTEAKKKGINSGIERAKQLIRSDTVSIEDAKDICRFKRFFGLKQTPKVKAVINQWGGREFILKSCKFVNRKSKKNG